ncbi:hypothetical protein L1887_09516 [Cichorium endivia]|nr:hypothetical protein L1887_09516 [Cichorium endivia]
MTTMGIGDSESQTGLGEFGSGNFDPTLSPKTIASPHVDPNYGKSQSTDQPNGVLSPLELECPEIDHCIPSHGFDGEFEDDDNLNTHRKTIQTQKIDLNSAPSDNHEAAGLKSADEGLAGIHDKIKHKQKKSKKAGSLKNTSISMKLKDVIRASNNKRQKRVDGVQSGQSTSNKSDNSLFVEIQKTKNIGEEVGFRLDGFKEQLRTEIEGEGVPKQQS